MLRFFKNYSLSKKLTVILTLTAAVSVVTVILISAFNDVRSSLESAKEEMGVLAEVVAKNSVSSVIFDDTTDAYATLSALQAHEDVAYAEILNNDRKVFVRFVNNRHVANSWWHQLSINTHFIIERPIALNGKTEGILRLEADAEQPLRNLAGRLMINFLGLWIAFFLGYLFLSRITRFILDPIERLAMTVRSIIEHNDYSLRVKKSSDDELGVLADEFNQMLAQIEIRDNQLQQSGEALAQSQEAISLRDENLRCQYVNPAFVKLFGFQLQELYGKPFNMLQASPTEPELSQEEIYDIARENGSYRGEVVRQTKSGALIPISLHVSPIKDSSGKITGYVSISSDISEKKQAQEWIWKQANFDSLTGLPNRNMFYDRLQQEIIRTKRTGVPFALMLLDLDDFKEVNDNHGHDMGDQLLKEVAERLLGCLRESDAIGHFNDVARLGGDEFTIILNNLSHVSHTDEVVQRILQQLAQPFALKSGSASISASIGITIYPNDAQDAEALIKNADQTMYHAKNKGRNTFSYFTREMQVSAQKRREMINDLRIAIDEKQFKVVFQPVIDMATNKIIKAEALIRWAHPTAGLISPAEFIPLAEETGMIIAIGDWMFYEVAQQLVKWRKEIDPDFKISINKSPVQFNSSSNNHRAWFEHLKSLGLPGESLIVEITEGLMLNKDTLVNDKLLAFRNAGVQLAVDDFGTGYSSLSYLKKLDIDYIKIDKSFIQNLSIYSEDMILCEAIIVMAHKLDLQVIAEGVETTEQRDLLFAIGCDFGQGYLFSRPIPPQDFEILVKKQNKQKLKTILKTVETEQENSVSSNV